MSSWPSSLGCLWTILILQQSFAQEHTHAHGDHQGFSLPVLVDVGIFIDQFYGVNNKEGTFKANIYLLQKYYDRRNGFVGEPGQTKVYAHEQMSLCETPKRRSDSVCWTPKIKISNMLESRKVGGTVVAFSNGTTERIERFEATFETSLNFAAYPFDKQALEIKVEPEHMFVSHMWLREWADVTGLNMEKYMESIRNGMSREQAFDKIRSPRQHLGPDLQWVVTGFKGQLEQIAPRYAKLSEDAERSEKEVKMRYVFSLDVSRSSSAYVWNFIIPTNFLAVLSWSGFWISPAVLMPRVATSFVAYLTFLNFQHKHNALPLVTYSTWHDVYVLIANIFIFLALTENVACQYLVKLKSSYFGDELDKLSRVLYPFLFVVAQLLVYLLGDANLEIVKLAVALGIVAAFVVVAIRIKLRTAKIPPELWEKGFARSMQNKEWPMYICLLDSEIETIFKAIDRDESKHLTPMELAEFIGRQNTFKELKAGDIGNYMLCEFGQEYFSLADLKKNLHALYQILNAMLEGSYKVGMVDELQSPQSYQNLDRAMSMRLMHKHSRLTPPAPTDPQPPKTGMPTPRPTPDSRPDAKPSKSPVKPSFDSGPDAMWPAKDEPIPTLGYMSSYSRRRAPTNAAKPDADGWVLYS